MEVDASWARSVPQAVTEHHGRRSVHRLPIATNYDRGVEGVRGRISGLRGGRFAFACFAAAAACTHARAAERRASVAGVPDRALRSEIELAVGEERKPPVSRLDARRRATTAAENAIAVLRSEGYYDAVLTPEIGEGEKPRAVVNIALGRRTRLGPTTVEWVDAPPDRPAQQAAIQAVGLNPGRPGRAADVIAAEGRIVAFLQKNGYADAKAQPREVVVDHADQLMTPTFKVAAGSLVKLGAVRIDSAGRTNRRYIRTLAPWRVGEVYRPDKVAELERRLLDTHVYDSVTVSLAPTAASDGLRPVIVNLADRARHTLEFSAGYSTSEGADFDVRWSSFDRFGRADTLTYEARLADIDSRLGVDLSLPNWRRPGLTLHPETGLFRTNTDAYTETGARAGVDLTQRYGRTSYLTSYLTGGVSLTGSQVVDKETGTINIVALRLLGALALDHSDNTLDPRRGFKFELRGEPTGITGDEQLIYLKLQSTLSGYLPLDRFGDTVVAARLHVGSIVGGSIPQVPSSDRFFAGGGGSVRGYTYQGVGPHYADGTPQGGLALVETSLELRRRLTDKFGGVLFIDSGSVSTSQTPDLRQVFSGVGVGLRYNLGFAPIRVDFAVPLNKPVGVSQGSFQVYLSVGQAF